MASQRCFQQEEAEHVDFGPVLWSQIQTNTKAPLIEAKEKSKSKTHNFENLSIYLNANSSWPWAELRASAGFPSWDPIFESGVKLTFRIAPLNSDPERCAHVLCAESKSDPFWQRSGIFTWEISVLFQLRWSRDTSSLNPAGIFCSIQCVFVHMCESYILFSLTWSLWPSFI